MELVNYWQIATCISLVVAYFSTKEVVFSCNRTIKILERSIKLLTALYEIEDYARDEGIVKYDALLKIRETTREVLGRENANTKPRKDGE